jgi:excinuclease ABC subunit A
LQILSPLVREEKGTHKDTLTKLLRQGFERVRIDGEIMRISEVPELDKNQRHHLDIVVDRIVLKLEDRQRISESLVTALNWSHGFVTLLIEDKEVLYSEHHACKYCGFSVPELEPRLFSFNAPLGSCPECKGIGFRMEADPDLIVPDKSLSIIDGAIKFFGGFFGPPKIEFQEILILCKYYQIPTNVPFSTLTKAQVDLIMYGSKEPIEYTIKSATGNFMRHQMIEGVKTKIDRRYLETTSESAKRAYETFMRELECSSCQGKRLNKEALSVQVNQLNIYEVTTLPIKEFIAWVNDTYDHFDSTNQQISKMIVKELLDRAGFLVNVGLDYLTLSRLSKTLSGGESQRIRLATQIGSKLSGILYVLDEPSIGLHQKDNDRLIETLKSMRDLGNTVLVVEHDEETIMKGDFIVDIGPQAGIKGGEIVYAGDLKGILKSETSITGQYLSRQKYIPVPKVRNKGNGRFLEVKGATCNNLKNIDVKIPLNTLTVVTGVSGSGKSSLVNETIVKGLMKVLTRSEVIPGPYQELLGIEHIDKIINIDQEPIGRTPRSNPATYTEVFTDIRNLYAETKLSRERGYGPGRFSFNVKEGRCAECDGDGVKRIQMNFLPDVEVQCESCGGKKYNKETLEVKYHDKSIFDILDMPIEEAREFFSNRQKIYHKIKTLNDVGLGYLKLGQSSTTLSGGESQRIKLAYELQRPQTGRTLYVLDEPTTGLHTDDVAKLIKILQYLVSLGNSVLVIEHNLDMIKIADYIIDLGPDGGYRGGQVVVTGTPEEVSQHPSSYTAKYVKVELEKAKHEGEIWR